MRTNKGDRLDALTRNDWSRREFISSTAKGAVGATVGASLLTLLNRSSVHAAEGSRFQSMITARSTGGVVASISGQASDVAIDVLNNNGNAIDAAVATLFALGVVRPDNAGLGGDGQAVLRMADGRAMALDFRCAAGESVEPATFTPDGMHKSNGSRGRAGHRVTGIPGVVAGAAALLNNFGSGNFTLAQLISAEANTPERPVPYAYELAHDGFEVTFELGFTAFLSKERLAYYPETAKVYGTLDYFYEANFLRRQLGLSPLLYQLDDYASSLQVIMRDWPEFYRGTIALQIDKDSKSPEPAIWPWGSSNDKGTLFFDDLANYCVFWREPIIGHYRNHQIITMPPPSGGGVAVMEMLNILERFPLNRTQDFRQSRVDHLHLLAEAQKLAYADRRAYIADPRFYPNVLEDAEALASKPYARKRAVDIDMDNASNYQETKPGLHTNHFSIIDRMGNAIAVTNSQGDPFGSGVTVPGAGFLLTNQLADWIDRPGSESTKPDEGFPDTPNGFLDQPLSRARPMTSATPTIVLRDGVPVLVVGGAGSARIPMGVLQTIVNVVDFGLDIARAVDAERIDAVATVTEPRQLALEVVSDDTQNPRISPEVQSQLRGRDHVLKPLGNRDYDDLPWIEAVGVIDSATGEKIAVKDPRHRRQRIEEHVDEEKGAKGQ